MGTTILAVVFLLLGLFIIWVAIRQFMFSVIKMKWPVVDGHISESVIDSAKDTMSRFSNPARNLKKVFAKYTYSVEGTEYTEILPIYLKSNLLPLIEKQLEKYPVGKKLQVYYNPDDPQESVIRKPKISIGTVMGVFVLIVIGGLFCLNVILHFIELAT